LWGYRAAILVLLVTNIAAVLWIARSFLLGNDEAPLPGSAAAAVLPTLAGTAPADVFEKTAAHAPTSTVTPAPILIRDDQSPEAALNAQGVLLLAIQDGPFSHLFAYHPLYLPLARLTNTPWDDAAPSISPDGKRIAYAARKNGYWDLYALDLTTGQETRLTDTPEYESSPTWSPDGQWIAFERYNGTSLDIYIQSLTDPEAPAIQLTDDPGVDRSPAWAPGGREIAFVSSRSGDEEIWLAELDQVDDRFTNLSRSSHTRDRAPAWSADGNRLAWASENGGDRRIVVWDRSAPLQPAKTAGQGDLAAWSPDGTTLFSTLRGPNQVGLSAFTAVTARMTLPYLPLPGDVVGMTWVPGPLPAWLADTLADADFSPAPALWQPALTRTVLPAGRAGLAELPDVTAPQPALHDAVDEAFNTLRAQVGLETGWDALSSLENAYVPLTAPLAPSMQDDWLYTGRAFAINPLLISAGWISVNREDFHGQTYWRIYLKARYQDGSMGAPLTEMIWDLNARYAGDARAYENGGKLGPVPAGYWIDMTALTQRYGWERLPAGVNWRTFYPSIRYNQFVMTGGRNWQQAMLELYPPEALATPTPLPTYTPTALPTTARNVRPLTPTPSQTPTQAATRRPTWTPPPGGSPP
jgi:TolB protein